MIRTCKDVDRLAAERGRKRLAVLAPEDEEFMSAVTQCWQSDLVTSVLIGNRNAMGAIADKVAFDVSDIEQIPMEDRQAIVDLDTSTLCASAGDMETVNVISLGDVPETDHLIALTNTGINIQPDYNAKKEIIKNTVFLFHTRGYGRPRIGIISSRRSLKRFPDSYRDTLGLREEAARRRRHRRSH